MGFYHDKFLTSIFEEKAHFFTFLTNLVWDCFWSVQKRSSLGALVSSLFCFCGRLLSEIFFGSLLDHCLASLNEPEKGRPRRQNGVAKTAKRDSLCVQTQKPFCQLEWMPFLHQLLSSKKHHFLDHFWITV